MTEPNVKIDINIEVLPFGKATVASAFAHPVESAAGEPSSAPVVTPVMPLASSVITPGHARPVRI
jgi:hypothetical protein